MNAMCVRLGDDLCDDSATHFYFVSKLCLMRPKTFLLRIVVHRPVTFSVHLAGWTHGVTLLFIFTQLDGQCYVTLSIYGAQCYVKVSS